MAKWGRPRVQGNVYDCMVCDHRFFLCVTVSLGSVPFGDALKGLHLLCDTAEYASRVGCCNEAQKVSLEGLGSLPKQMHEKATRF